MLFRRLILAILLVAAVSTAVSAQPAPTRGARSLGAPYAVPGGVQTRGTIFVVTTTVDEDDNDCDSATGAGLSLREALENCDAIDLNGTVYIPSGLYLLDDDLDSDFDSVTLIGEDPLTTIVENNLINTRSDGRIFGFSLNSTVATIANLTLRSADSGGSEGGAVDVYGTGSFNLNNVVFDGNSGGSGGALYILASGALSVTISNSTFSNNDSTYFGGALNYNGAGNTGSSLALSDSVFTNNQAVNGGALYLSDIETITLSNLSIQHNSAVGIFTDNGTPDDIVGSGGGFYLRNAFASMINSDISLNKAGTATQPGAGGGVTMEAYTLFLFDSTIQDNGFVSSGDGPQCYGMDGGSIDSGGQNTIEDTSACSFSGTTIDLYDNLLANGSFEKQGKKGKPSAASWDLATLKGARTCNKPNKPAVSESGACVMASGGGGGAGKISQKLTFVSVQPGDVLTLAGKVKKKSSSTQTFTATATFSDGTAKMSIKLTFAKTEGLDDWHTGRAVSPLLTSGAIKKLTVTLISSKPAYFDDVYLFVSPAPPRTAAPQAAPAGLRGSN